MKAEIKKELSDELRRLAEHLKAAIDSGHRIGQIWLQNYSESELCEKGTLCHKTTTLHENAGQGLTGWVGVEEAAEFLRMKKSTLYSWTHLGKVPFKKVNRKVRFSIAELDEWASRLAQESNK